jgi:hypothetical protein
MSLVCAVSVACVSAQRLLTVSSSHFPHIEDIYNLIAIIRTTSSHPEWYFAYQVQFNEQQQHVDMCVPNNIYLRSDLTFDFLSDSTSDLLMNT